MVSGSFLSVIFLLLIPYCLCESHYSILGVSKNAKVKEIKKAYSELAQKWNSNKNTGEDAEHMMSKLNKAYEILSDEDKRRHYDLLEYEGDDAYTTTSDTTHGSTTDGSSLGEVNTREFMEDILPASETIPYLIYFFHDFCERCEDWNEVLNTIMEDVQLLGIKMASVNVIVSNKVASHCNVYVHEVPQLVLVINRKPHPFKGSLSLDNVKQFIHDQLPSDLIKHVEDVNDVNDILSMESRIKNNKPVVLFVSPQDTPSLNFKMAALRHQKYLVFYFLSSMESEMLKMFKLTEGQEVLLIYSDSIGPTVILEGTDLKVENISNALENNKWLSQLSVPRVNSCTIMNELCPVGINARSCVLLVADGNEKVASKFRAFAIKQNDANFNTGILMPHQSSVLKSAISQNHVTATGAICDNSGILVSRPVLIIRRLSNTKLEYSLLSSYCGTRADNVRILGLLSHSKYTHSAIMATPCSFGPIEPRPVPIHIRGFIVGLSEEILRFILTSVNWENISSTTVTVIYYGLLLIIPCYMLWSYYDSRSQCWIKDEIRLELKWQELVRAHKKLNEQLEETNSQLKTMQHVTKQMKQVQEDTKTWLKDECSQLRGNINQLKATQEEMRKQMEHACDSLRKEIEDVKNGDSLASEQILHAAEQKNRHQEGVQSDHDDDNVEPTMAIHPEIN